MSEDEIRNLLSDEVDVRYAVYSAVSSPHTRRAIRRNMHRKKIEREFTQVVAKELEYSAAIPAFVVWWLLSTAVRLIITEMAKRLYDRMKETSQ